MRPQPVANLDDEHDAVAAVLPGAGLQAQRGFQLQLRLETQPPLEARRGVGEQRGYGPVTQVGAQHLDPRPVEVDEGRVRERGGEVLEERDGRGHGQQGWLRRATPGQQQSREQGADVPLLTARRSAVCAGLAAGLLCGTGLLPFARFQSPAATGSTPRIVRGAVHVHRPVDEEAAERLLGAALDAGLDFVVTTTPGTLDPTAEGHEGYYTRPGRVAPPLMVLAAAEIPSDRGPLLILGGLPRAAFPLTLRSDDLIAAAHASGALVIALRPCRAPQAPGSMPAPDPPDPPAGVDGVEVLSVAADFSPGSWLQLAAGAILAPLRPSGALAALARPDGRADRDGALQLSLPGMSAPIGGIGLAPGSVAGDPEPETVLGAVTTRVILDSPWGRSAAAFGPDRAALLGALAAGQTLAVAGLWGEPGRIELGTGGDRGTVGIQADHGTGARWILSRDARVVAEGGDLGVTAPAATGIWRAAAWRRRSDLGLGGSGWLPWVVAGPWRLEGGV